jgi:hypothetical protein
MYVFRNADLRKRLKGHNRCESMYYKDLSLLRSFFLAFEF